MEKLEGVPRRFEISLEKSDVLLFGIFLTVVGEIVAASENEVVLVAVQKQLIIEFFQPLLEGFRFIDTDHAQPDRVHAVGFQGCFIPAIGHGHARHVPGIVGPFLKVHRGGETGPRIGRTGETGRVGR